MKVLVLTPKMMVDDRTLLDAYNRIVEEIRTNSVTMISDNMFDYEIVEIDDIEVKPTRTFDVMSKNCRDYRFGRFFTYCHRHDNFGNACAEETCPMLRNARL